MREWRTDVQVDFHGDQVTWDGGKHDQLVTIRSSAAGLSFSVWILFYWIHSSSSHQLPVCSQTLLWLIHFTSDTCYVSDNLKLQTMWKKCRSHTVWLIFIKCSNTTEITAHGEVKYQRASSSRRLVFQQESLRKDAVKLEGKEQSDKQTSSANPFDSGELALCETGKNGSSNYQRTQWDCFLHAGWHFDLRGNNESNQKLMPALPLGSQPIRGMFTHRLWGPPCFCLASCPLSGSVTVTMIKRRQTACERSY